MNYQDQIRNNEGMAEDMFDNYVNEQERKDAKRKELIPKFKDGWARYSADPLFRDVIDALVRGDDPLHVIEILIESHHKVSARYFQLQESTTNEQ